VTEKERKKPTTGEGWPKGPLRTTFSGFGFGAGLKSSQDDLIWVNNEFSPISRLLKKNFLTCTYF
jgi:hypothetical protein